MSFPKLIVLLGGRAIKTLFLTCLNFLGSLKSKASLIQVLSLYMCVCVSSQPSNWKLSVCKLSQFHPFHLLCNEHQYTEGLLSFLFFSILFTTSLSDLFSISSSCSLQDYLNFVHIFFLKHSMLSWTKNSLWSSSSESYICFEAMWGTVYSRLLFLINCQPLIPYSLFFLSQKLP